MLQIKKNGVLSACKYNVQFLFRNKGIARELKAQKKTSKLVILRAPKNFNIGKHKILTLNYTTPKVIWRANVRVKVSTLIDSPALLYSCCSKRIKSTPVSGISSIRFSLKTKFRLKWLVV